MPHSLPKTRRCQLLSLARSTAYYQPAVLSNEDLKSMCSLGDLHLKLPFKGSRRLRDDSWDELGLHVIRKRIQRLMRLMSIQAVQPGRKTTIPNKTHKTYPYLLKNMTIDTINLVWCSDITYITMREGLLYLVAIMDWHSLKVLSWRLSNSLDTDFCVEALTGAVENFGGPGIFNTDQGC
jgi:putative transposase